MRIFKRIMESVSEGNTLYFPGCLAAAKLPHVVEAQKSVLRDMNIKFITFHMECCGFPAWWAGHEEDFKNIMERNKRKLSEQGVTRIITGCPHCALTFRERYGVETKHLLEVYSEHLEKVKLRQEVKTNYHHPCFMNKLGVDERVGIRVLRRAGIHAEEDVGKGCCGSVGGDFERNNIEESKLICRRRCGELRGVIVTACPYCIMMFRQQRREVKDVAELLGE